MRRARPEEAAAIQELVLRAYAHYPGRIGLRPAPMDADYADELATKEVWVAPAEGAPLAVLIVHPESDHLFVDNVAVAPEAQGGGVGRALLDFAEGRARELELSELRLYTHERMSENRAIYAHLGWEETVRRTDGRFARVYLRKRV